MDNALAAEQIDRLATCDLNIRSFFPALYEAARNAQGGPLCQGAADRLHNAFVNSSAGPVLFITGFYSPVLGVGEQDGPVGTAYLARVLEQAYGAVPVVVTDTGQISLVTQTLRGGGFNVIGLETALESARIGKGKAASVIDFPVRLDDASREAQRLLDMLEPRAIIAIERPGRNVAGKPHSLGAIELKDTTAATDVLLSQARDRGCTSIAIADAGNETGSGVIHDEVNRILGEERRCKVCGEGIAAVEAAEVLVLAAVSNWGAYGVAAALALELGDAELLPGVDVLEWTIRACALAGGRNGMSDWTDPGSDGLPLATDLGVLTMLRTLVQTSG